MLSYVLNPNEKPPQGGGLSYVSPPMVSPPMQLPNSLLGLTSGLLQPAGFDNLVDGLGLGSLFGQTSFETVSSEGQQIVDKALEIFKRELQTNPSLALTNYAHTLNKEEARFYLMIDNAKSSRFKRGLPISLSAIQKGIENIKTFETEFSKTFNISKTKRTDSVFFKKTRSFSWYDFILTSKKTTKVKLTPEDLLNTDKLNTDSTSNDVNQSNFNKYLKLGAILLLPFGLVVWGLSLLIKKRK